MRPRTYPPPSLKRRWGISNENNKCRQFIESMQDGEVRGATYLEILAASWVRDSLKKDTNLRVCKRCLKLRKNLYRGGIGSSSGGGIYKKFSILDCKGKARSVVIGYSTTIGKINEAVITRPCSQNQVCCSLAFKSQEYPTCFYPLFFRKMAAKSVVRSSTESEEREWTGSTSVEITTRKLLWWNSC